MKLLPILLLSVMFCNAQPRVRHIEKTIENCYIEYDVDSNNKLIGDTTFLCGMICRRPSEIKDSVYQRYHLFKSTTVTKKQFQRILKANSGIIPDSIVFWVKIPFIDHWHHLRLRDTAFEPHYRIQPPLKYIQK